MTVANADVSPRPLTRLLVANRGEIARRIFATARSMGVSTVAVHSDADAHSPHVIEADLAVRLAGNAPSETYLRADLLIEAARATGADAVHPGYGFLSESGDFARAVVAAGLLWVGPPAAAIDAMGSKIGAKELMRSAGVPTLDSLTVDGDTVPDPDAVAGLGWPILVKASAGGGGRGMRVVERPEDLAEALSSARREAVSAFGDGTVFLEHYVSAPRHIEVQVLADAHGAVVSLFERECSIQRRHQKIIEEAPSPFVSPELRGRLSDATVAAARAVGYVNAGTVEFVVDQSGQPYFLEMNTRLQVEHPVTEAVTGLDLVRHQLLIAQGHRLADEVHAAAQRGPVGHAIEARLYAEDPAAGWLPSTGRLEAFDWPGAPMETGAVTVRIDAGVVTGSTVTPHYDPMLAKVIVHAPLRAEAAGALSHVLATMRLHGVTTNRDLLVRVLRHPSFLDGSTDTGFLERHGLDGPDGLAAPLADSHAQRRHAVAAAAVTQRTRRHSAPVLSGLPSGWRGNPWDRQEIEWTIGDQEVVVGYRSERRGHGIEALWVDGNPVDLAVSLDADAGADAGSGADADRAVVVEAGVARRYRVHQVGHVVFVDGPDGSTRLVEKERHPAPQDLIAEGSSLAPMPGSVVRVAVEPGQPVARGDVLIVLEAMKMEHAVRAAADGRVAEVHVAVGDQVETGRTLVVVAVDELMEP